LTLGAAMVSADSTWHHRNMFRRCHDISPCDDGSLRDPRTCLCDDKPTLRNEGSGCEPLPCPQ
jgi:hypothetical protein